MGMLIQVVRYTNPKQNLIQTHIIRSTDTVQDVVFFLLVFLYVDFRRVMFIMIWVISTGRGVLLVQYLNKGVALFHMGVFGVDWLV